MNYNNQFNLTNLGGFVNLGKSFTDRQYLTLNN